MPLSGTSRTSVARREPILPAGRCVEVGCAKVRSASHWTGIAFGVGLASFAAYQQFKFPVVLPVLLDRYGYDRTLAGACMSVYALAGLLLSLYAGSLVERRGAVPPVCMAMAFMLAGTLLPLAAPAHAWLMLFGRGLEGVGFAMLAVCGPVIANASAPPRQVPLVAGLAAMWIPVGQLSATALAPAALALHGWTLLWWTGAAGCVAFTVWTLRMRRMPALAAPPAASVAARPTLGRRERGALAIAALVFGIWSGQYFAFMTWMPQFLVEVHRLGVSNALIGYVVPVVLVLVFNLATGAALRAGLSLGTMMAGGLAAQAAVWWCLPLAGAGWLGVSLLVVYGVSAGVVPACLFATPGALTRASGRTAAAFGYIMTGRNLGVLIGPVLLAQIVKSTGAWDGTWPVFGALTTFAFVLGLALARRLRPTTPN